GTNVEGDGRRTARLGTGRQGGHRERQRGRHAQRRDRGRHQSADQTADEPAGKRQGRGGDGRGPEVGRVRGRASARRGDPGDQPYAGKERRRRGEIDGEREGQEDPAQGLEQWGQPLPFGGREQGRLK